MSTTQLCLLLMGAVVMVPAAGAPLVLLECEGFEDLGGWDLDQQAMDQMGSPYLLAHGLGIPVDDATTTATIPAAGTYRLWARTRDWVAPWGAPGAPGRFQVTINGQAAEHVFGTVNPAWHWEDGGLIELPAGRVTVGLHDLMGFEGRCDAILLAGDPDFQPPEEKDELRTWRRATAGLSAEPVDGGDYDMVIVGGGMAGTSAALSAARQGLRVALIQNRPVLGGNSSSEVRVWPEGHTRQRPYRRVGEIVEEIAPAPHGQGGNARDYANYNDQKKMDPVVAEERIALRLWEHVNGVETDGSRITAVIAQHVKTGQLTRYSAPLFADCTGDGTVGYLAGADFEVSTTNIMGSSNLWNVLDASDPAQAIKCECKDKDEFDLALAEGQVEQPFPRTPWAHDLSDKPFPGRQFTDGQWRGAGLGGLGAWFWESGFDKDQVADIEQIRDNNFRAMYGAWDTLKNVDGLYPNHRLNWVAFIAGKRESRRLMGDIVLSGDDFREGRRWPDAAVPCSWHIDVHFPDNRYKQGFSGTEFISDYTRGEGYTYGGIYWAPYRMLYSRNIDNLFMAGRDVSVDQEGLGPVRVMRTGGMMGEIVGKAAWICRTQDTLPRGVYQNHLSLLRELMMTPGPMRRESLTGQLVMMPGYELTGFHGRGLDPAKISGLVIDDEQAVTRGSWSDQGNLQGFVGEGYLYSNDSKATIRYPFTLEAAGDYRVSLSWQPHENRAKRLRVRILAAAGEQEAVVDQSQAPGGEHDFRLLGTWRFEADTPYWVELVAEGAGGTVHADAVRIEAAD